MGVCKVSQRELDDILLIRSLNPRKIADEIMELEKAKAYHIEMVSDIDGALKIQRKRLEVMCEITGIECNG